MPPLLIDDNCRDNLSSWFPVGTKAGEDVNEEGLGGCDPGINHPTAEVQGRQK